MVGVGDGGGSVDAVEGVWCGELAAVGVVVAVAEIHQVAGGEFASVPGANVADSPGGLTVRGVSGWPVAVDPVARTLDSGMIVLERGGLYGSSIEVSGRVPS